MQALYYLRKLINIKMSRDYQYFLINSLFKILGNLKCFKSTLYESLKSQLCLRNTFLNFLEVESTPDISSSEFYVFSKEGLAVSTLRQPSYLLFPIFCLLLHQKDGVAMLRLEISTIGRSKAGELAYRQVAGWQKKLGGSFELLMRMFLRSAKLLLMLLVNMIELSMQNYMLEIQLFDSLITIIYLTIHLNIRTINSQDISAQNLYFSSKLTIFTIP